MLRCVKRKSSKSRTPATGSSNERGCSTLPRMFYRSDSEENVSEKPSSSSFTRLTRWTTEKKSATLAAGSTLSSGNDTKPKSKPLTFLRTLSLGSLFSPSRKRRKDDSTTAYSSGLMSPDVELQTFSNESQANIHQEQNETDISPSEGSLTPTGDETYQSQLSKQELYLEKLTRDAYNYLGDETNKTPTDENPRNVSEAKHLKRYPDDQHDSGRSSTRESADVSVASEGPKKKTAINDIPLELERKTSQPDKHWHVSTNPKQADLNQSFLRAARAGNLEKLRELLNKITDINVSNTNGLNALHLACKEGKTDVVKELLSRGASVHLITRKGNTALHIASLAGHLEIVQLLVDYGADVNAQSQNGFTPLYMSAQENHVEVVQYLLDKSANQALSTEDGFTPLAVALQQGHDRVITLLLERDSRGKCRLPALHIAAKKDDVHAAKLLLNNSEINVDHTSASGFTPLHIAAHYGNVNMAKLLIERGANINYQAKNSITPLHVAAKWGKNEVVGELILAGAEINARTRDGLTPLHCASRACQIDTVEYLLKNGADHSLKTKNGLTPLHLAAQGANERVVQLLLQNGSNPDDVTIDYLTPLHVAAHCGNVDVARALLNSRCNVNARALNGFTALHIACKKSRVEMASILLKYGALIEAATETGLTPLHVAAFVGCIEIVSFLLQHGTNVNQTTLRNETALHLATRNRQLETVRTLLGHQANLDCRTRDNQTPLHVAVRTNFLPIVELLLDAGSDPNIMTRDNYAPLHIAIKEDSEDIVKLLIEHDANPEVKTKKGFTPLHLAAKYGSYKTAHLLMDKAKSNPNAIGPNGFTPVHVATYYNDNKMLDKLIEFGGDVNRPVKNGFTPLHLAAKRNQLDSIRLLASKGAIIDKGSRNGYTPLHLASQDGRMEIVKVLVEEYKAQVDTAAKDGLTPLHLAVQEDKVNVAEYLLNSGASIDTKTLKAGFTPLHSCAYRGQLASVRLLLSRVPEHELPQFINCRTHMGSTPLHLAAQQGHLQVALKLIQMGANPNICNKQGWTAAKLAHKQHYLNLFEMLQSITTDGTDAISPGSDGIDDNINLNNGLLPLEKAEHMTDHMISDSEDEGDNDITTIPSTPTMDNKQISVRPKTLHIPGNRLTASGVETVRSSRYESIPEEHVKPMLNGKVDPFSTSQQLLQMTVTEASPAAQSEWDFDVDNVHSAKNLIKSGFLISFIIDARGGLVEAQRRPGLRFLVPPNAVSGPLRIICRLLRPETIDNPPVFNDGDCLACRVIEMNPTQMRFTLPVLIEVPHIASVRGREREVLIIRSETGNSWKEHTLESTELAINDSLSDAFDHSDLNTSSLNKRIHRILTYDFPQYFALISRFRQEVAFIGSDGGLISSTVAPQVQAVFPPGSLQKRIKVGLQAQLIHNDIISRLAGDHVSVSPVVSIEPRRRKFHKPITLTIPVPRHSAKTSPDTTNNASKLRLLCSLSGGINAAVWEDITGSTPMTRHKDCVSFTTTVSARLWLMDCPSGIPVSELATRIYSESIQPPIFGRFVIYARQSTDLDAEIELETPDKLPRQLAHVQDMKRSISRIKHFATEFAHIRCVCLTDDNNDKTLECLEHYCQVAIGPFVEIEQNKPIWIEMVGNLVPVLRSGEQLNFTVRPFHENRITFPVRLRDVLDQEPDANTVTGKVAFMREPRKIQTNLDTTSSQTQRPLTLLEFKLPNPDQNVVIPTREPGIIGRSELDRQMLSLEIGEDWRRLAPLLGFSEQDIKNIERIPLNYRTSGGTIENQRAENMLVLWQHRLASSGIRDKDALGNCLADALIKINRSDAIHPSMTDVQPVTAKEEITTATKVLEERPILPSVAEEILPNATTNEVLTYPRRKETDSSPDMKYQEKEETRKLDTDLVLSWSENAFLSSDEGVSTISVSGETDGIRKPEATVLQSVSQTDVTDQEKLSVDVHTVPSVFTSVDNVPDKVLELNHINDIGQEKPCIDWQEALLTHLKSVGVLLDFPTNFSQSSDKRIEEPDSHLTEVFIKPKSQYVEHKSTSTDKKVIEYVVQDLLDTIGPQFDESTASVDQRLPIDHEEIMEDIIEQTKFDRKAQEISVSKDSESMIAPSIESVMPQISPTEEDTSTEVLGVSKPQKTDETLKEQVPAKQSAMKSLLTTEELSYTSLQEELNEEFLTPCSENLQDEQLFENAYQRAVIVHERKTIDSVQSFKVVEPEVLLKESDIETPPFEKQPQIQTKYMLHSDSAGISAIQSVPKESHEIEEVEEILPDGTVVTKRTELEETTLSVSSDEWELGIQAAFESGGYLVEKPEEITDVEHVEETLPDGTVITRLITTKRVVDRVFERSISEEQSLSHGVNEKMITEISSVIPEVPTTEDQYVHHETTSHKNLDIQAADLNINNVPSPNLMHDTQHDQLPALETIEDVKIENEKEIIQQTYSAEPTSMRDIQSEIIVGQKEIELSDETKQIKHATIEQVSYRISEESIEENTENNVRKIAAIKTYSKDLEEIDGGALKTMKEIVRHRISKEEDELMKTKETEIVSEKQEEKKETEAAIKQERQREIKSYDEAVKAKSAGQEVNERLRQVEADAESEAAEQVESERVSVFAPVELESEALAETAAQPERERLVEERVGEMEAAEYGEVGEGVFEGEVEAESVVEVFGETLGQVEADAESEAAEQVESERVSVFAPVELESEALAETAAQPERERLVEERVGEMEAAEYGEVGEGVFEGEVEAESVVEVFGETLGQVEADAESEAAEQVESERVSVFAPVELESEALAETAAQPEREGLVEERVGEMEAAEYGEVGEGVFEGEVEAESVVEVFGETLGQVEADAESEAAEQVESERVSVFAPVELESEALAETAAQPERERLVEERVGEMEAAEYGEVGEGVFEGEVEAESVVEVFGETLGQVEADAESEAAEQVESERVSVFAPVELESEALAETAAQPERERLVEERVGEMEAAEYGEVGEGVFEGEVEAESVVEVFGETLGQVEADAESEAAEQVESERVSVFAPVELESEALAETAAQPERERLVEERVGEMEAAEYGEVGEGVFEGEVEAESVVEVFGETLGQVEADAESEAAEQVESERVSVFAPVELESEALAETAAQPERERLVEERVGEMEAAEYGEVGEGVFEGEVEAESVVEVFGETLGQVEADAESEAAEQVESERVSVFAPVELESEALAETAAQPERERLVEERVGEMEAAEYGEVGEGVFEGEVEAESVVEVFGETLGQVEADAESEAAEQVESERVSVFAPVELESEALAETAAQPERERLVEERVGEMEAAEYGEVGEGVFEGEVEAESVVEVFGETLGQVEADAESEAAEQVESERVSVFAPVELESEALAETAAQPERERLVEERVGEMEAAEYGEVGEGVFEGEVEAESVVEVFGETLGQVEADAESEAAEQVESERVSVFAPVELESEALAETAAQPERERLVEERVGEMEAAEYGEVGEGVFEGEVEAESVVEVFGETLGQVEADAESEAAEQVESERVSVFAPVELESEALAETAAQPERERLVEERVGEMEAAEYGEVGEGVFEGEVEAESVVEVFGETLGQVEADAESEAAEQVESERVSVFAPVELESEALAETAAQPERERLVEERVGEMEAAEYGEVGEGVFEGEVEAESVVEVFGETLGQVEADAESEAAEQVESERVSVFAPVELESEALAETAAQPERERLVEERVGEMEAAEYGEVGEGVFEGEVEAESVVEVFGETLGQVEADAESEAAEQVESERVSVFAPVELESEALAETAAQPEREGLVEERVGEMEAAEYGEVGEGVFEGEVEAESVVEVFGETLGQVEADAESEAAEQVESERVSVFAPVELESEALAETAAQPEREGLVEERVGEMEAAEYGEVGEGVFEGEVEAESVVEVFGETLGQVEADAESEAAEQVESERVSVFAPVELESEALAETAAQPEREGLVEERVGEMEAAEYGEVGEGVFEGEVEAESVVEVFGETLGQVEADAESEAAEQVESERVSVFAPVELESEALAETAAQPEREGLVEERVGEMEAAEYGEVGEGVFEGEVEAESVVEVFGETLGQVEADAESEAAEQVESERVSVFAPVELESEALAETAAQPERERLVEERVGEMEAAEYGEVGEGVFEGEVEAESVVEVFGETLGQVEADAESEAAEQFVSDSVSFFVSPSLSFVDNFFFTASELPVSCTVCTASHASISLCHIDPVLSISQSPISSSQSLHAGLSDFSRMHLDSASLDSNILAVAPEGLFLGLSQFVRHSTESFSELHSFSIEDSVIPKECSDVSVSSHCGEIDGEISDHVQTSPFHDTSLESIPPFKPEASVLALSEYEYLSVDELRSSNRLPSIIQATANVIDSSDIQEVSQEDFINNDLSITDDQTVLLASGSNLIDHFTFESNTEYDSLDCANKLLTDSFDEVIIEKPSHELKMSSVSSNEDSLNDQPESGESLVTETIPKSDILDKSPSSEKANLTYLAAASGASVAMEFTDEEEEEDEFSILCPGRLKSSEHGDSNQLVHSALDRSARMLTRLQTYGFRGNLMATTSLSNLNWRASETKLTTPHKEFFENDERTISKGHENILISNKQMITEPSHDELDNFDGDSLEGFSNTFEFGSIDSPSREIITDETEGVSTGLPPILETVNTNQLKFESGLKSDTDGQKDSFIEKEISIQQHLDSESLISSQSIAVTKIPFSPDPEFQTSSTPDESSLSSYSTVVNVGRMNQSPIISQLSRGNITDEKLLSQSFSSQGHDFVAGELKSVQLLDSRTTLESIESDLDLLDDEIKLGDDKAKLTPGKSLVHLSSVPKRKPVNYKSNLLGSEPVVGSTTLQTSTDFGSIPLSQPIYSDQGCINITKPYFHETIEGHISFPRISEGSSENQLEFSSDRVKSTPSSIYLKRGLKTCDENVASSSLPELERFGKELGNSDSTSPSSGHKGSGEDVSSHTSSLSEYLRHEKECESCDESLILPFDSRITLEFNDLIDMNDKAKTVVTEMLTSNNLTSRYGQISTIYEDLAEHNINSLSQSIESPTTSVHSVKEDDQISCTYLNQNDENKSQVGCSDSELLLIHSNISGDPLQAETTGKSLTSSSEIEPLLNKVEDYLIGVEETDSLICSSIYDSLVPSGYENSLYDAKSNVNFGINDNWRDLVSSRRMDSLDENEYEQLSKTADSLSPNSSSAISNRKEENTLNPPENNEQGTTEFDSVHIDNLHQQYIGTIGMVFSNESYSNERSPMVYEKQPQSLSSDKRQDSNISVSGVVKHEYVNKPVLGNYMTDSLDDNGLVIEQIITTTTTTGCSLSTTSETTSRSSCSFPASQITPSAIEYTAFIDPEALIPTTSEKIALHEGIESGFISKTDLNPQSTISNTLEDETLINKPFAPDNQGSSDGSQQWNSLTTSSFSAQVGDPKTKETLEIDNIASEEVTDSCKQIHSTDLTESFTDETSSSFDYEMVSITEREKSPEKPSQKIGKDDELE
ncbi:unnamed protein product [Schistosoma turkestanicum]|nr:unnamed protein product [Schistosoma turkestanicum]